MVQRKWFENEFRQNSMHSFATQNFNKLTETFQITIDYTVRHMEDKVKDLGVIFGSRLSLEHNIKLLSSRLNGTLPQDVLRKEVISTASSASA